MMNQRIVQSVLVIVVGMTSTVNGFTVVSPQQTTTKSSTTTLNMGLFDGVREAFSAPTLEQSQIDKERETPIDRWMGWTIATDTKSISAANSQQQQQAMTNFVDSMDEKNYVIVELEKPMGIVFEENDADFGGIFVQAIKDDSVAFRAGTINEGDQLVGVDTTKVTGLTFDESLNTIVSSQHTKTKLTLFRGSPKQLYGPTGASQKWLDEFIGVIDTTASTATTALSSSSEEVTTSS